MRLDSLESNRTLTQGVTRVSSPEGNNRLAGKFYQKLPKVSDTIVQRPDRSSMHSVLQSINQVKQGGTPESRKSVPRTSSLDPLTHKVSKDSVSSKDQQLGTPRIGDSTPKLPARSEQPILQQSPAVDPPPVPEVGFFRKSLFSALLEPTQAANQSESKKQSALRSSEKHVQTTQQLLSAVPYLVKQREVNPQIDLPKPEERKAPLLVLITQQLFKPPQPQSDSVQLAESKAQPMRLSPETRGAQEIRLATGTNGAKPQGEVALGNEKSGQVHGLIGDSFWKTAVQNSAKGTPKPVHSSPNLIGANGEIPATKDASEMVVISRFSQFANKSQLQTPIQAADGSAPGPLEWPPRPPMEFARTETKKSTIPVRDPENEDWVGLDHKTKIKLSELWNQPSDDESEDSNKFDGSEMRPQLSQEVVYPNPTRMRSKRHSSSNWFGGDSSRSYLNKSSVRFH